MTLLDQTKGKLLDWSRRFNIICGTARGLLYLHQDSRWRIVHRDLKASNVTTRFHSFIDGNMSSVCDYQFVCDLFTDIFTDGLRPSAFPSSVIPHSVVISVGNTKKPFANGFTHYKISQFYRQQNSVGV